MILAALRAFPLVVTMGATAWALSTNPLAAPLVERGKVDLILTLERQVRRAATTEWITAELDQATQAEDLDRAEMLIDLARDLERPVDTRAAEAMIASRSGWTAAAADCAACMVDVGSCPSIRQLAACAVPFELSPLGDANALRRAGIAWWNEEDIDGIDAGLAVVGLGATGAVVMSGGSSLSVKAGAGMLRIARRMGTLTPGLTRLLDVTDVAKRPVLQAVAADLGAVRAATSAPETLRLMRLVDTPEDAARLARVAEAAGPRTTRTLATLGKARAFRATLRLSRMAAGTLILLWLCLTQVAMVLAVRLGGVVARTLLSKAVDSPRASGQS
ncbi:hypothetical protein [Jannaschia pohangensis]|uniref:Uncharacterized protein n=1 Tax=Jannaschia pohangensis TaxID=390807 RepID=A0A1I3QWK3_9RHOB|nr:hypothetical protein [Jannaschia pohangensis]SFJ38110.1 hypothetical protein SAMN04488095_2687 [Jannaschia pohangensis]